MKNNLAFMLILIAATSGTFFVLTQNTYASSTYMTLHNLTNETAELWIALPENPPHCDTAPHSTCIAGTEYVWYTIKVSVPNSENPTWEKQLSDIFGSCNIYVTGSDGKYDAQHNCAVADKLALKPPAENKTR